MFNITGSNAGTYVGSFSLASTGSITFVPEPSSALLVFGSLFLGCGGDAGPKRYTATGTVSFNGQPLPDGDIQFLPAEGTGPVDALDGAFHKALNGFFPVLL